MPFTIRTKIILGLVASLIFISVLSMAFGLNIMTLKNKIVVLDEFHGLLDYQHRIQADISRLSDFIGMVAGIDRYDGFKEKFETYRTLMGAGKNRMDIANVLLGSAPLVKTWWRYARGCCSRNANGLINP